MFTLKAENEYGQVLSLTENENYTVTSVEGLDEAPATINSTKNGNEDGADFNSSTVNDRQIIITLTINYPAELNRINLYKYFKTSKSVKLYYTNGTRDVFIEGICQNVSIDLFAKKQIGQITIDCLKPFFNKKGQDTDLFSNVVPMVEFPLEIEDEREFSVIENTNIHIINEGDVETGCIINIHADFPSSNPVIYNLTTGEFFGLIVDLAEGDDIYINTKNREKDVYLMSNGVKTGLAGKIIPQSQWLKIIPGNNELTIQSDGTIESLVAQFTINQQYIGV